MVSDALSGRGNSPPPRDSSPKSEFDVLDNILTRADEDVYQSSRETRQVVAAKSFVPFMTTETSNSQVTEPDDPVQLLERHWSIFKSKLTSIYDNINQA